MKTTLSILVAVALLASDAARADTTVAASGAWGVDVGALGQMLGFAQHVEDPYKNDYRFYLFLKEARFRTVAHYQDYKFNLELGLGAEDTVVAPNPGVALGLLDFNFDIPLHILNNSYVKVGQFKVPYGREALTYSAFLNFTDRSIDYLGFRVGRDVGAAVTLKPGPATITAGVFTGGGRDVPPTHYLPEKLGFPLVALRAGIGDVDLGDVYHLRQSDPTVEKPRYAVFINGLYTKDSRVGHSTVLNVKEADKSLLLNANWNPFIAKQALEQGQWWQTGIDAAMRAPVGHEFAFAGEVEADYGGYTNSYGAVQLAGGRAQASIERGPFLAALRYAVLWPNRRFASNGVPITGTQPIQELTPALTWRILGDSLKVIADLPVVFHAPVVTEQNVGSYVATELPDQTSLLGKTGTVARQNVVEGRLMLQGYF